METNQEKEGRHGKNMASKMSSEDSNKDQIKIQ